MILNIYVRVESCHEAALPYRKLTLFCLPKGTIIQYNIGAKTSNNVLPLRQQGSIFITRIRCYKNKCYKYFVNKLKMY